MAPAKDEAHVLCLREPGAQQLVLIFRMKVSHWLMRPIHRIHFKDYEMLSRSSADWSKRGLAKLQAETGGWQVGLWGGWHLPWGLKWAQITLQTAGKAGTKTGGKHNTGKKQYS